MLSISSTMMTDYKAFLIVPFSRQEKVSKWPNELIMLT